MDWHASCARIGVDRPRTSIVDRKRNEMKGPARRCNVRSTLSVLLCVAVLLPHAAVSSVVWSFQQIAVTGAVSPGGGTFTGFGDPSISGGTTAFFGTTS